MNIRFLKFCFHVGVIGFVTSVVAACVVAATQLELPVPGLLSQLALPVGSLAGTLFIGIGLILLVYAIKSLHAQWKELTEFGKFLSVIGLISTSFAGGYIYYYYFKESDNN